MLNADLVRGRSDASRASCDRCCANSSAGKETYAEVNAT